MEWIPKLYDTLDSITFEMRMRWAGHVGQAIRNLVLLAAVITLSAMSPGFQSVAIATITSFLLAELASAAIGDGRLGDLLAVRRKSAA